VADLQFEKLTNGSLFRKIFLGTWKSAGDPSIYGLLEVDMTEALRFIEEKSQSSGEKITPVHFVGAAVAKALRLRPELNSLLKSGGIYKRSQVDLFFMVNIPGGEDLVSSADLAGTMIRRCEDLQLKEFAEKLKQGAHQVRKDLPHELRTTLKILNWLPAALIPWMIKIYETLNFDWNISLKFLGFPRDPFGSAIITNVGSLGIDLAWAPLVPFSRVPVMISVGRLRMAPCVVGNQVLPRPMLSLAVTVDHRLIDGVHAGALTTIVRRCFENPFQELS
jgi:pyruvate/2-oxoglutarate dehydrogenase complex dihydrolipoamide acyltransferase (E2) component